MDSAGNLGEWFFMTNCTSPLCLCLYVLENTDFLQSIIISIAIMLMGLLNNTEFKNITKVTFFSFELLALVCQILFYGQKGKTWFGFSMFY